MFFPLAVCADDRLQSDHSTVNSVDLSLARREDRHDALRENGMALKS